MRKDVTAGLYGGTSILFVRYDTASAHGSAGHYERKLKHLNKQKEGKKRLKKLAGNIDIPQSAFFDVLSSRPRTFSTSARRTGPTHGAVESTLDHLPDNLPPPSLDLTSSQQQVDHQLHSSELSTTDRSMGIAELHWLLSQKPVDHDSVITAFDRITRSSPGVHVFTPPELRRILSSLAKTDKRHRHLGSSNPADIARLRDELNAVSRNAHQGMEQALVASLQTQARASDEPLREMEKRMMELFPRPPHPTNERIVKRYRVCVNYLLQLYALAGDVERFGVWRSRLTSLGLEDDSYSALAKVTLASKAGDHEVLDATLRDMLETIQGPAHRIILVNYALWSLAVRYRWDIVLPTYHRLTPSSPQLRIPNAIEGEALPLPLDLTPSTQTFSLLLHSLSHQGHFDAAVTVLQTMVDGGYQPHVAEYTNLFKGFARHGVVPTTKSGRIASSFPLWERLDTPMTPRDQGVPRGHSISQIWQRGATPRLSDTPSEATSAGWTESALQAIFTSFLQLSPAEGRNQAPTPKQTFNVLMAFARTTNANDDVVRSAWESMEAKFTEPGWWGWRLDGRLERLKGRIMQGDEPQEW